ncbi:hypothetical protein Thi970DRAFT_04333 [Thiorhodovibrio frisius]|uniref:Uncharacterized protein n=1 Tax=Thiorhodovibrio frisius TaxID=631362 RepID=H8Z695_9GAMM|nr:hypothetical protein Thi970DRAFT_04333 [Thiorhodovibrio frisius]WPL21427.1 hypothetical protein Thiofri_01552 [Thiorhodovibrio frisius]
MESSWGHRDSTGRKLTLINQLDPTRATPPKAYLPPTKRAGSPPIRPIARAASRAHTCIISEGLDPDEVLKRFDPEARLRGLDSEARLKGLDPVLIKAWLKKQRSDP